jgi:hypothetical protein
VPEDARGRRVGVEHFGSEVLEPGFGNHGCQLVGGRRRSGRGSTGAAGLGYHGDAPAGPQQPDESCRMPCGPVRVNRACFSMNVKASLTAAWWARSMTAATAGSATAQRGH